MFLRTLGVPIEIHEAWKKGGESRNNLIKLLAEANFNKDSLMIFSWISSTLNQAKIFTFRNWDILKSPNWLKNSSLHSSSDISFSYRTCWVFLFEVSIPVFLFWGIQSFKVVDYWGQPFQG